MAQKQYPLFPETYEIVCQITLKIQKVLTSSNQIFNLGGWKNCPCRLCRLYIADIEFIES